MKLKDYFQNKQEFQLTETDKLALYEKILSQQKKKSLSRMVKVKYFVYWLILFVLLFGIYWVYFDVDWDINWIALQNPINQANADYIAKVVSFNGTFYIQHDWKLTKTSNISNWDNVILKKWSEIVFDIDSWTKAKLTWPARFSLAQDESGYQLLISEWDFVHMESIESKSAPVEISMWDFKVSSEKDTNILITKADNEYKVNNQWWDIKVTKNGKETQVKTKELVAINENDITLVQNVEQFQTAFVEQKINQTFEIKDTTPENLTDSLVKELATWTVKIENTWLATELWIIDTKQIPSESQTKSMYDTLDKSSLSRIFENMWKAKKMWDLKEYKSWMNQLNTKIQNIYKAFNLKDQSANTKDSITSLISKLDSAYHIPEYQLEKMKVLVNWINYLEALEPYKYEVETQDLENAETKVDIESMRSEFEKNIPSNLVLK